MTPSVARGEVDDRRPIRTTLDDRIAGRQKLAAEYVWRGLTPSGPPRATQRGVSRPAGRPAGSTSLCTELGCREAAELLPPPQRGVYAADLDGSAQELSDDSRGRGSGNHSTRV